MCSLHRQEGPERELLSHKRAGLPFQGKRPTSGMVGSRMHKREPGFAISISNVLSHVHPLGATPSTAL